MESVSWIDWCVSGTIDSMCMLIGELTCSL